MFDSMFFLLGESSGWRLASSPFETGSADRWGLAEVPARRRQLVFETMRQTDERALVLREPGSPMNIEFWILRSDPGKSSGKKKDGAHAPTKILHRHTRE